MDGPDAGPDGGGGGAVATFAVTESGPMAFDDIPFPHDLHLGEEGTVDLEAMPGGVDEPLHLEWLDVLNERDGFCTTCNAYFPIDGALDPASLPEDAGPKDEASADDPIVMMDIDPDSPEHGRMIPVRTEWQPLEGRLAVAPVHGVTLHRERTYAVALTDRLKAADGSPVAATEIFAAARDEASGGGAAVERARAVLAPALDQLEEHGVDRARIVSAAVFTTDDVLEDMRGVRGVVRDAAAPEVVAVDRVYTAADGGLDELFGRPAGPGPGVEESAEGEEGPEAVPHDALAAVVLGRVTAPRVMTGSGPDVGRPLRDASGALRSDSRDEVPFALAVPDVDDLASLPIVVHVPPARRSAGLVVANTYAERGIALLTFDIHQFGQRAKSASDDINTFRGDGDTPVEEPDGVYEQSGLDATSRFYGLAGTEDAALSGLADFALASTLQLAADIMSMVRFVREADLGPLQDAAGELASLGFDPERAILHGRHRGGSGVLAALAVETDVSAAVLCVSDAGYVETLALSPRSRLQVEVGLLPRLQIDGEFDGVERRLLMSPMIDLYRWTLDPADPRALAPYVLWHPVVEGPRPHILWLATRHDEQASALAVQSVMHALGLESIGAMQLVPLSEASAPLEGNLSSAGMPVTAGARMLEGGNHADILPTQPSGFEAPIMPPFQERGDPAELDNDIEAIHAMIAGFAESAAAGSARITLP